MSQAGRKVKEKRVINGKTWVLYEGDTLWQCEGKS